MANAALVDSLHGAALPIWRLLGLRLRPCIDPRPIGSSLLRCLPNAAPNSSCHELHGALHEHSSSRVHELHELHEPSEEVSLLGYHFAGSGEQGSSS